MKRILVLLALLAVLPSLSAIASAATLHVGSGQAYSTIQSAVNAASSGDTVLVHAGTYHEVVTVSKSGITISSNPDERPVIDGQYTLPTGTCALTDPVSGNCLIYKPLVTISASSVTFKGFEVTQSRGRGIQVQGSSTSDVDIIDCWIHENRAEGIFIYWAGDNILIENCKVWLSDNFATYSRGAGTLNWPGAVAWRGTDYVTVRGCEVFNNWGEGILPMQSFHGNIIDNVVYDNYAAEIYGAWSGHMNVERNLVYHTNTGYLRGGNPSRGIGFTDEAYRCDNYPQRASDITVTNNLLVGNLQQVHFGSECTNSNTYPCPAEGCGAAVNSLVAYNTMVNAISNTDYTPSAIQFNSGSRTGCRVENNIFLQDTGNLITGASSSISFSNNLWSRNYNLPSYAVTNNFIGNPQLEHSGWSNLVPGGVNPEWFRILSTSPARDKAKAITEVLDDYFGTTRGSSPDIGAHEYSAAPGCAHDSECTHLDDLPCVEGFCDSGTCSQRFTTNPCDDGVACTENDVCSDGACSGTPNDSLCDARAECASVTCSPSGCSYSGCPRAGLCEGLELLMHFDGNAVDESGNGHDGTVNGAAPVEGRFGQAFRFDGDDDYISTPSIDLSGTDQATVSFWFRPDEASATHILAEMSDNYNSRDDSFIIYVRNTDIVEASVKGDHGYGSWFTDSALTPGNWYHITAVLDKGLASGESAAYLNGTLDGGLIYDNDNTNGFGNMPIYIGSRAGTGAFANGTIDELAVWNRSLGPEDAMDLFANGPIDCSPPIHRADTSEPFGCVDSQELTDFINHWYLDSTAYPMGELMEAVGLWKAGC